MPLYHLFSLYSAVSVETFRSYIFTSSALACHFILFIGLLPHTYPTEMVLSKVIRDFLVAKLYGLFLVSVVLAWLTLKLALPVASYVPSFWEYQLSTQPHLPLLPRCRVLETPHSAKMPQPPLQLEWSVRCKQDHAQGRVAWNIISQVLWWLEQDLECSLLFHAALGDLKSLRKHFSRTY